MVDKENEERLKRIFIKMLKDEKIRKLAKKTFIEFFETPEGFKMTYEGMSNGLNS